MITANFEPAWESARAVPTVSVDFGNGTVVKRTLQGNIATYVCGPDGAVYDVLPGIYVATTYLKQLNDLRDLARPLCRLSAAERGAILRGYHAGNAARLAAIPVPPAMRAIGGIGGGGKGGIGGIGGLGLGGGLAGGGRNGIAGGGIGGQIGGGIEGPLERAIMGRPPLPATPDWAGPIAANPVLALDAEVNERVRRPLVHQHLATRGPVRPDEIKKWLF